MDFTISVAEEKDADEIDIIARQSEELHQKKEPDFFKKRDLNTKSDYIKNAIKNEDSTVFKACHQNKIIGYLVLYIHDCPEEFFVYPEFGYIGDLCVDKEYRRQGVAQALISEAEKYLISKNIRSIELDVFLFNEKADRLYTKIGYKNLKYRKRKLL